MKRLNLRGFSEVLSEKELKNVMGDNCLRYLYPFVYRLVPIKSRQGIIR